MALWSLNTNEVAACLSKEGLAQMYNIFCFYYSLTVSPKDHLLSKNLLCCDEYLIESGATVFRCQALGTSSVSAVSTLPSQEIWEWNGIIHILRQNFTHCQDRSSRWTYWRISRPLCRPWWSRSRCWRGRCPHTHSAQRTGIDNPESTRKPAT